MGSTAHRGPLSPPESPLNPAACHLAVDAVGGDCRACTDHVGGVDVLHVALRRDRGRQGHAVRRTMRMLRNTRGGSPPQAKATLHGPAASCSEVTHVQFLAKDAAQEEADVLQDGVAARVRVHVRPVLLRHVLRRRGAASFTCSSFSAPRWHDSITVPAATCGSLRTPLPMLSHLLSRMQQDSAVPVFLVGFPTSSSVLSGHLTGHAPARGSGRRPRPRTQRSAPWPSGSSPRAPAASPV